MDLKEALMGYIPYNEQEEKDREQILKFLERGDLVYTRESKDVHMTASAWVTNRERSKILMAYHIIFTIRGPGWAVMRMERRTCFWWLKKRRWRRAGFAL